MAGTVNKVILIGHLGEEVKMQFFEGGNAIGRFSLATNETFTNRKTGERTINTDWHNILVRNKLAEICEKYLSKGDKVYIEGRIKNRQWTGEDGQPRYTTEIQVQEFTFLSPKGENTVAPAQAQNQQPAQPQQASRPAPIQQQQPAAQNQQAPSTSSMADENDDDLPF